MRKVNVRDLKKTPKLIVQNLDEEVKKNSSIVSYENAKSGDLDVNLTDNSPRSAI